VASVTIDDVGKMYGAVSALRGISIDIADGEFLALVGPSGCGKSTLLRIIAGLEPLTSGTVSIGGEVVNDLPPKSRDVAMVFQNYALYPHMSVAENMAFALKLRGVSREQIDAKIQTTSRLLDLDGMLTRYPSQLSGGQRQRVAMGRAIVRDPSVFLFDEPLSNLDAKLRVQLRAEIKELHQRLKTTTVYVTHDQVEAMTMADRIAVMRGGEIEQMGSPMDLYDDPRNLFVAGFIGSPAMNVIPGEVDDGVFLASGGFRVAEFRPATPREPNPVVCCVRPHKIAFDETGTPATVVVVEPLGGETQVIVRLGETSVVCLVRDRTSLRPGDTLHLRVDANDLYFFDRESGQRIDCH
jgi:multiple sugar transport system ATP-binding protein